MTVRAGKGNTVVLAEFLLIDVRTAFLAEREWFTTLKEHFPSIVEKYKELYPYKENAYKFSHVPQDTKYLKELSKKIADLGRKYGMNDDISHPEIDKKPISSSKQKTLTEFGN